MKKWKCLICSEIVEGEYAPDKCPVCGVPADKFVEVGDEFSKAKFLKEETYIILGGGIAGLAAAEAIRKRNPVCTIEIISEEEVFCYNRPMLTKGILQELDAERFFTRSLEWYEKEKIRPVLGVSAIGIDREKKEVYLSNGEKKKYDKLIYALGAEGNVPPIEGSTMENVITIRQLSDVNYIKHHLDSIENVAIIGGGILGLEGAWEFVKAGKKVKIIEVGPRVMGRQLDQQGADILKKRISEKGAEIYENVKIKEIIGDEYVDGVLLENGTLVLADMVVISAGNKPNVHLAQEAGLDVSRFVEVDKTMKTSDPDIYACGDVAACEGVCIAIWPQALEMGKVAGANAAGDKMEYGGVTPANSFVGFDTKIFSIGDVGSNDQLEYTREYAYDEENGDYKSLYFVDGVLVGGILMGDTSQTEKLISAYVNKAGIDDEIL